MRILCLFLCGACLSMGCGGSAPEPGGGASATPREVITTGNVSVEVANDANAKDTGPPVLGFDRKLRRQMLKEMKAYVQQTTPAEDVDAKANQMRDEYLANLEKFVPDAAVRDEATQALRWKPGETEERIAKIRMSFDGGHAFREFSVRAPDWAAPLQRAYEAGELKGDRRELLFCVMCIQIMQGLL